MGARFIDFDAARAEREREPLTLQAYGRSFELPSEIPAGLYVDLLRMEVAGEDAELSDKDALGLMQRVIPSAVLDSLLAEPDFSLDDLLSLTQMVMRAYRGEAVVPLAELPKSATK